MDVSDLDPLVNLIKPTQCTDKSGEFSCREQTAAALFQCAQQLGFDHLRCTRWVSSEMKVLTDTYSAHISNFPEAWTQNYDKQKFYLWDPIIRFSTTDDAELNMPFGTWDQARLQALNTPLGNSTSEIDSYKRHVKELFDGAKACNLNSGVFMIRGEGMAKVQMSLASTLDAPTLNKTLEPRFWNLFTTMLVLTENLLTATQRCSRCTTGILSLNSEPSKLTESQKAILTLFNSHRDATIEEISRLHFSSVDNVNYHLRNIRSKFNQPGVSGHMLAQFAREHTLI